MLDDQMCSCNGGILAWQLNKWFTVPGKIIPCRNGLHLTLDPRGWQGSRVFIAETPKTYNHDESKIVARKARLLHELTVAELEAYEKVRAPAWKAYKKAEAPAWKAYDKAGAPALEAYEKVRAQAWEAYEKVRAQAWEAYEKVRAQALEAYEKARAQALEAYEKARAPALEAYEKACQTFLTKLLMGGPP